MKKKKKKKPKNFGKVFKINDAKLLFRANEHQKTNLYPKYPHAAQHLRAKETINDCKMR